ncbi:MAG TPA: 16S rRNA (cytosine(1402)-N(4))-methyltransferase RsmH [Candidatus Saccharimonadales bacterium]|nr:16S rRNA (cytosine(1402)-N(4))-methyltransferase RsmH [Candidatus Saccharimonadales bacterium]
MHQNNQKHIPVLLGPVLEYLAPRPGETYLDLTAGYGGHAQAVLDKTHQALATLVDRDSDAIQHLHSQFKAKNIAVIQADFLSASRELHQKGEHYDLILADLGISSPHLNTPNRGFAFATEGPLDMRQDQSQTLDAYQVVNTYKETELVDILRKYGEEPRANKIAREIVRNRPIKTTTQLAQIARKAWPAGSSKVHPATRTFQAIRIAVNDELGQLEQALPIWIELLKPGGRIGVISFHSLEDRLVKQALQEAGGTGYDAILSTLTKHPVTADSQEIAFNPRARSAKFRAAVKIKTKERGA